MIDKKQLIEELLDCVIDATDTETQITGLSMCVMLMNEVIDEALTLTDVVHSGFYCMDAENSNGSCHCPKQCNSCVGY
jgi:hypothetical protein